ncbi:CAAX protease [Achromobacter aegrifaciens]|uniref:CAAX protease n=1 Tax=Achromobacter aegrifaciens TaxID=1287736 RepID=A0ABU2D9Y9_ACHAE|nr:CAAX protease [Achromobacter aegrifaciens]MDR7944868.1 CAAX protease [Achromobacter aegrifaciens]
MEAITNLREILFREAVQSQSWTPADLSRVSDMPTTLQYRPILIDTLISNERMSSYQTVFSPANDVELMGAYLWNTHASGALYPLISAVEITLRNAIDRALTADLGSFWWSGPRLLYRSYAPGAAPPYAVQAVHDNFVKATRKYISEVRSRHRLRGHIIPNHAGVISKTEFSSWEFLLNADFMGRGLIWPKHLSTVFRGPWPTRQASAVLAHGRDLVATLREFRNRLFHHEPAWKRYGVQTEAEALQHLHEKIDKAESLLALIHPENLRLLQIHGLLRDARRACTSVEIRRFQHRLQSRKIHSPRKLARLVDQSRREHRALAAKIHQGCRRRFLVLPE